jgi:hypothetical protein
MPQDDISSLSAKIDFLIDTVNKQDGKISHLQRQFDQSKGALGFIKIAAVVGAGFATMWAVIHGFRP